MFYYGSKISGKIGNVSLPKDSESFQNLYCRHFEPYVLYHELCYLLKEGLLSFLYFRDLILSLFDVSWGFSSLGGSALQQATIQQVNSRPVATVTTRWCGCQCNSRYERRPLTDLVSLNKFKHCARRRPSTDNMTPAIRRIRRTAASANNSLAIQTSYWWIVHGAVMVQSLLVDQQQCHRVSKYTRDGTAAGRYRSLPYRGGYIFVVVVCVSVCKISPKIWNGFLMTFL